MLFGVLNRQMMVFSIGYTLQLEIIQTFSQIFDIHGV